MEWDSSRSADSAPDLQMQFAVRCALQYNSDGRSGGKNCPPERLRERRGLSPDLDASTSTKQVCLAGAPAQDNMIFLRKMHKAQYSTVPPYTAVELSHTLLLSRRPARTSMHS